VIGLVNVCVSVSADLKKEMNALPEVNWSEVVRAAIREKIAFFKLAEALASESKLSEKDAEEIGRKIKKGIAAGHKRDQLKTLDGLTAGSKASEADVEELAKIVKKGIAEWHNEQLKKAA